MLGGQSCKLFSLLCSLQVYLHLSKYSTFVCVSSYAKLQFMGLDAEHCFHGQKDYHPWSVTFLSFPSHCSRKSPPCCPCGPGTTRNSLREKLLACTVRGGNQWKLSPKCSVGLNPVEFALPGHALYLFRLFWKHWRLFLFPFCLGRSLNDWLFDSTVPAVVLPYGQFLCELLNISRFYF